MNEKAIEVTPFYNIEHYPPSYKEDILESANYGVVTYRYIVLTNYLGKEIRKDLEDNRWDVLIFIGNEKIIKYRGEIDDYLLEFIRLISDNTNGHICMINLDIFSAYNLKRLDELYCSRGKWGRGWSGKLPDTVSFLPKKEKIPPSHAYLGENKSSQS